MKCFQIYTYFLIFIFTITCSQKQIEEKNLNIIAKPKEEITSYGPKNITRNIIQDKKGNIWIASFDGIFRYDGKSFNKVTSNVTSTSFFSILEDSKGNFWFGSIGSGVYHYDGKSFRNLTTKEGLLNNEVCSIYEDEQNNIWFGVSGGVSCYDGKSFRNFIIDENVMKEDLTGLTFKDRQPHEVNSILKDNNGKFWFATRGNTYLYDGKIFTVFAHKDKPFQNVRSMIIDKNRNIWLAGSDGLWRYDGSKFTCFTKGFVGYVFEDKKGNIWTSSNIENNQGWALSKYDEKKLNDNKPLLTEIAKKSMIFGILEAQDGTIWFGDLEGVNRYDGNTITDFKSKVSNFKYVLSATQIIVPRFSKKYLFPSTPSLSN